MGWFDWLDVNTTEWETSYSAAVDQADTWIEQVADAKGWSSTDRARASAIVEDAKDYAEGFGGSATDTFTEKFWAELTRLWSSNSSPPNGWDQLGDTFASASGAAYDPVERVADTVTSFVDETFGDVRDVVDPSKSPWPWVLGGVVAFFLVRELRR